MDRIFAFALSTLLAVIPITSAAADDELPASVTVWPRGGAEPQTLIVTPTEPVTLAFREVPAMDLGISIIERGIEIASIEGRGRVIADDATWPLFSWQVDRVNHGGTSVSGPGQPLALVAMRTNSIGGVQSARLSYPAYAQPEPGLARDQEDYALTRIATATLSTGLIVLPGRAVGTGDPALDPNRYLKSFLFEIFRDASVTVPWLPGTVAGMTEYEGRPALVVVFAGEGFPRHNIAVVREGENHAEVALDGFVLIDLDGALPRYGEYNLTAEIEGYDAPDRPISMTVRTYLDYQ